MLRRLFHRAKQYKPEFTLDALEERIVLDASVSPVTKDNTANSGTGDTHQSDQSAGAAVATGTSTAAETVHVTDTAAQVFEQDLKVVLISNALDHIQDISQAAADGAKVIVYDASKDLSAVVTDLKALVESSGAKIGQLAFFTYGEAGVFKLTEHAVFSAGTVNANPGVWQDLGSLLAAHAEIDFYGCNIGKGSDGLAFVSAVADTTGAVVWASNNITGTGTGADWVLEVKSGDSSRGSIVNTSELQTLSIMLDNSGITNAGFETGDLTGWTTLNETVTVVANSTAGRTQGAYTAPVGPYSATISSYLLLLDSYNTNSSDLTTPAKLSQTFQYTYQDHLTFAYDFVTTQSQGSSNDYFQYRLYVYGQSTDLVNYQLAAGSSTLTQVLTSGGVTYRASGWNTVDIDLSTVSGLNEGDVLVLELTAGNTNGRNNDSWAFVDFLQAPASEGLYDRTVFEDAANTVIDLKTWMSDREDGSSALTYEVTIVKDADDALPTALFPTLFSSVTLDPTTHVLTLDYAPDAFGTATLKVKVTDSNGGWLEDSFNVTVLPVSDLPTVSNISVVAWDDTSSLITVTGYDPDRASAGVVSFGAPATTAHGTLTAYDAGPYAETSGGYLTGYYSQRFLYTPTTGYVGTDSFDFTFTTPSGSWKGYSQTAGDVIGSSGTNMYTHDFVVADFNQDGYLDIFAANYYGTQGNVLAANYYYQNDGTGHFTQTRLDNASNQYRISDVAAVGDLNGDGYFDVAVRNESLAHVIYYWDPQAGAFKAGVDLPSSATTDWGGLAVGDVTGDDIPDIMIVRGSTSSDQLYKDYGAGIFSSALTVPVKTTLNSSTVNFADFNNDGTLDALVTQSSTSVSPEAIYWNAGLGRFTTKTDLSTTAYGRTYYAAIGDIDNDGWMDFVTSNHGTGTTSIDYYFRNNQNGTFTATQISSEQDDSCSIRLADVDNDGDLDIVKSVSGASDRVYLNTNGTFAAASSSLVNFPSTNSWGSAVGDFNNDGYLDYVQGMIGEPNKIWINLGQNDYSVTGHVDITVGVIKNRSFQNSTPYNYWSLSETTYPSNSQLGTVALVSSGTTIGYLQTVHDYINGNEQPQHSFYFTAYGMPASITVKDSGPLDTTDLIALQLANGPRTGSITQDVTLPSDPSGSISGLSLTWHMSYWEPSTVPFDAANQYIAVYVYDASGSATTPIWTTTAGSTSSVGDPMQTFSAAVPTSLLGKTVTIKFEVVSKTSFLHVAVDDFMFVPTFTAPKAATVAPVWTGGSSTAQSSALDSGSSATQTSVAFPSFSLTSADSGSSLWTAPTLTADSGTSLLSALSASTSVSSSTTTDTLSMGSTSSSGTETVLLTGLADLFAGDEGSTTTSADTSAVPVETTAPVAPDTGVAQDGAADIQVAAAESGEGSGNGSSFWSGESPRAHGTEWHEVSFFDPDAVSAWHVLALAAPDAKRPVEPDWLGRMASGEVARSVAVSLESVRFTLFDVG